MKVYILKKRTVNHAEPMHYSSYENETIIGLYSSHKSAIDKMEELHDVYRKNQIDYPEFDYISESCEIEEHELIP